MNYETGYREERRDRKILHKRITELEAELVNSVPFEKIQGQLQDCFECEKIMTIYCTNQNCPLINQST